MTELKVGDTIWQFDHNHRVYPKDKTHSSGPIYREYWRPVTIDGENSRSWIVGKYSWAKNVPKRGPHPGFAFTQQEVDDDCWIHDHRYSIAKALDRISCAGTLRKVAEIIGWNPEPQS